MSLIKGGADARAPYISWMCSTENVSITNRPIVFYYEENLLECVDYTYMFSFPLLRHSRAKKCIPKNTKNIDDQDTESFRYDRKVQVIEGNPYNPIYH